MKVTHWYNNISQTHQGMRVEPIAQSIELLSKNMKGKNQDNLVIDTTTGSSL